MAAFGKEADSKWRPLGKEAGGKEVFDMEAFRQGGIEMAAFGREAVGKEVFDKEAFGKAELKWRPSAGRPVARRSSTWRPVWNGGLRQGGARKEVFDMAAFGKVRIRNGEQSQHSNNPLPC